jgi:peroxiredoxin
MESHKNGNTQENSLDDNINKLNIADSLFKNQNIKNDFLNNIAFTYFLEDQNIVNNQKFIKRYLELSTSSSENDEIRKIDRGIKQLQPGNRLPEVELVDIDDKPFKLIGHTNRQTVIFFWTSCAHAHIKTVYDTTEALKKQFPDTDFIAVNVDDEQEWKKMMAVYKPNASVQVRAVNFQEIKDKWVLTKITRTIILNPDGTIKNAFTNLKDPNFSENLK